MERKPKFALIHGIINVLLPVIPVLMHRGVFGVAENTWQYIWLIFAVQVVPPLSSLAGIVIAGIQLKKTRASTVRVGLVLSCCGLALYIVFRFILKI